METLLDYQREITDTHTTDKRVHYDYKYELSEEAVNEIQETVRNDLDLNTDEHTTAILPGRQVCVFVGELMEEKQDEQ